MNQQNSNEQIKKGLIKIAVIIPALIWALMFVIIRSFYRVCAKIDVRVEKYMSNLMTGEDE
jgi:hypothetical protein